MNSGPSTTSRAPRSRLGRRVRWVIPLMMLLAVPPAVFASHNFGDVPTGSTFHTEISNLAASGITIGCGGGNYCPEDPVTRASMAGFLNRGLGRVTASEGSTTWALAETNYVASAAITTGGAAGSGGTGFVLVTGSVTAYTETPGTACPCEVAVWVDRTVTPAEESPAMFFDISTVLGPNGAANGSATVSWVFQVPAATRATFNLGADVTTTGAGVGTVDGALTVTYFPFGGTGSSTLSPAP
jgi:hypothetical protein